MDLARTYPNDPLFHLNSTMKSLKNILLAYSRRNVSIGYCQGFNFIVGRLLKEFDNEEESFWMFVQIIEHILPISYYSELMGVIVDTSILQVLVKKYFPDLQDHFKRLDYESNLDNLIYQWFVSLFIQNTNKEMSYLIWDCLFIEGNITLIKAALAMFKILRKEILKRNSMEALQNLLHNEVYQFCDILTMQFYLVIRAFEFDYSFLLKNRLDFGESVKKSIQQTNQKRLDILRKQKRKASFVKDIMHCQKDWPLCIYDYDYKYNNILEFLVFRIAENIITYENYFFDECFKRPYRSRSIEGFRNRNDVNSIRYCYENNLRVIKLDSPTEYGYNMKDTLSQSKSNHMIQYQLDDERRDCSTKPSSVRMNICMKSNKDELQYSSFTRLLIERRKHVCEDEDDELIRSDSKKADRRSFIDPKLFLVDKDKDDIYHYIKEAKHNTKEEEMKIIELLEARNIKDYDSE